MMNTEMMTTILVVGAVVILIIWDIYVAVTPKQGDTISEKIREWGTKSMMVPFSFGVLIGHWFW